MRRVLIAVLVILVVVQASCRSSREDEKDTQRVEHRVGQDVQAQCWRAGLAGRARQRARPRVVGYREETVPWNDTLKG
jgi:hypothetical protein